MRETQHTSEIQVITGRVVCQINAGGSLLLQIDTTDTKRYYVLCTGEDKPMINSEIQMCIKPLCVFDFDRSGTILYEQTV